MSKFRLKKIYLFGSFSIFVVSLVLIFVIYFGYRCFIYKNNSNPKVSVFKFLPKTQNYTHQLLSKYVSKFEENFNSEVKFTKPKTATFFEYYENYKLVEKKEDIDLIIVKDLDNKISKEKQNWF